MRISLDVLLEMSSNGDELATEAITVMIQESCAGRNTQALLSFCGKQITIVSR